LGGSSKLVRDWESENTQAAEYYSVAHACEAFVKGCEARRLSDASLGKYRLLTDELKKEFADRLVISLSVDEVR
jgi:hypothetical protein